MCDAADEREPAGELTYAPAGTGRRVQRVAVVLQVLIALLVCLLGWSFYRDVRGRLTALDENRWYGPIDSSFVLSESRLRGLVWQLAWSPADRARFVSLEQTVAGVRYFSLALEGVAIEESPMLRYRDGRLEFCFRVRNDSPTALLVPPVRADMPIHRGDALAIAAEASEQCLATGATLVPAGGSADVVVPISVGPEPCPLAGSITLGRSPLVLSLGIDFTQEDFADPRLRQCKTWADVPGELVKVVPASSNGPWGP